MMLCHRQLLGCAIRVSSFRFLFLAVVSIFAWSSTCRIAFRGVSNLYRTHFITFNNQNGLVASWGGRFLLFFLFCIRPGLSRQIDIEIGSPPARALARDDSFIQFHDAEYSCQAQTLDRRQSAESNDSLIVRVEERCGNASFLNFPRVSGRSATQVGSLDFCVGGKSLRGVFKDDLSELHDVAAVS
jgi:hypothetical protein